jgi:hypothetical protein
MILCVRKVSEIMTPMWIDALNDILCQKPIKIREEIIGGYPFCILAARTIYYDITAQRNKYIFLFWRVPSGLSSLTEGFALDTYNFYSSTKVPVAQQHRLRTPHASVTEKGPSSS